MDLHQINIFILFLPADRCFFWPACILPKLFTCEINSHQIIGVKMFQTKIKFQFNNFSL